MNYSINHFLLTAYVAGNQYWGVFIEGDQSYQLGVLWEISDTRKPLLEIAPAFLLLWWGIIHNDNALNKLFAAFLVFFLDG